MSSMSQNGAYRGPWEGSPALGGRLAELCMFFQWGSAIGRPFMAEPPGGGSRDVVLPCRFAVSPRFLWFLGLFLKCFHRINPLLPPFPPSLRSACNRSCFVKFEGRLTLQTGQNVKYVAERGVSGTLG